MRQPPRQLIGPSFIFNDPTETNASALWKLGDYAVLAY